MNDMVNAAVNTFDSITAVYTSVGRNPDELDSLINDVVIEILPFVNEPFTDINERDISSNLVYHRAKVRKKEYSGTLQNSGISTDVRIIKFKVSQVATVKSGDFITDNANGDIWIII